MGQVWIRSAAVSGNIFLEFETDEPGGREPGHDHEEPGEEEPGSAPFVPMLSGQYEGFSGVKRAAFQIQTVKGLAEDQGETRGLRGYAILGRLAYDDRRLCGTGGGGTGPVWCNTRDYSSGTYNFYSGRLLLNSVRTSDECHLNA